MRPRIDLFDPSRMDQRQREIYEDILQGPRGRLVGPLRAVLRVPELAILWSKFGEYLRYSTTLPARRSELAILVTARHWNSQVEWEIHAADAERAGVPADLISSIAIAKLPQMSDLADIEIYEFSRQLLEHGDVDQDIHSAIVARWGEAGVVELTAVVGYYSLVALMINSQGIPTICGTPVLERVQPENQLTKLPPAKLSPAGHGNLGGEHASPRD